MSSSDLELDRIRALGPSAYEVTFRRADETLHFQLKVDGEGDDIKVVTWQHDLTMLVEFNTGLLSRVFATVLSFHLARHVIVPPLS